MLHTGFAIGLRAPAARGFAQRSLSAGLHVAPPLLGRNRMLHRRFENMFRLPHRVRFSSIFKKSIHFFGRVFSYRLGEITSLSFLRSLATIQTLLSFSFSSLWSGITHWYLSACPYFFFCLKWSLKKKKRKRWKLFDDCLNIPINFWMNGRCWRWPGQRRNERWLVCRSRITRPVNASAVIAIIRFRSLRLAGTSEHFCEMV